MINKLLLLAIIGILFQIQVADKLHETGSQLCFLQNLPHRGLGMLYTASMLQPSRLDYELDYLSEWTIFNQEEMMIEGSREAVMFRQANWIAKTHPENIYAQQLAKKIGKIERERMR